MMWRKDNAYIGLLGRKEPNHNKGSAGLYGTGATVTPIAFRKRQNFSPPIMPEHKYVANAWVKRGHLTKEREFQSYAATVEEGKKLCDEWLKANAPPRKKGANK